MILNPLKYYIILIASILFFYSCNTTDYEPETTSDSVNVAILSISAIINSSEGSRKASLDSKTFESGDVIGLFILDSNHDAYRGDSSYLNLPAEYNGSGFDLSTEVILTDEDAYIYAYYPYCSDYGNSYPSSESSGIETEFMSEDGDFTDLLITGEAVIANDENTEAALSFYHGLARLVFSFNVDDTLGGGLMNCFMLESTKKDLSYSASFYFDDILTLGLNDNSSKKVVSLNLEDAILSSSYTYQIEMLVIPSSVSGKNIYFELDGLAFDVSIPTSEVSEWQSGVIYYYTVPITSSDEEGITAIDLGLSVKWAPCNVGASVSYECGDFFAWGEIETKDTFNSSNCSTYGVSLSDISGNSNYDAATANWGGSWRMPTLEEFEELISVCSCEWTSISGMTGALFTGSNGNSIFLSVDTEDGTYPAYNGFYWTSTPYDSYYAYNITFVYGSIGVGIKAEKGCQGYIRPVCDY